MSGLFDTTNTEVFGNSQFGDLTDRPMTLAELSEPPQIGDIKPLNRNARQRKEKIIDKRAYNLPQGTDLKFPYQPLADIVLGANKDVKFHRSLTSRANAAKYAANNRLRLGWCFQARPLRPCPAGGRPD